MKPVLIQAFYMDSQDNKYPEIRFVTTPKWAVPLSLFVAVMMIGFAIYKTRDSWAFGNLFPWGGAEAQAGVNWNNWNKIGVSSATPLYGLTGGGVRNAAALSGPGGSVLGIVQYTDDGWVAQTIAFINEAHSYCITPVLRLEAKNNPAENWGPFFQKVASQISYPDKLVISIGNEINHDIEWPQDRSPESYGVYLATAYDQIKSAIGSATVIGPPMNTSAPCVNGDDSRSYIGAATDHTRYMCWIAFMKGVEAGSPGILSKMNGHASHSYPIYPDGFGGDRSMKIYQFEKDVINGFSSGYSGKAVYIMETGLQDVWRGVWPDNDDFVDKVMALWNTDSSVVMVNFFNAMGSNTDPAWTTDNPEFIFDGQEVEGWDGGGSVSDTRVKFDADAFNRGEYTCEIVLRDEYVPSATVSGMKRAQCITNQLTTLLPEKQNYELLANGEDNGILLQNGSGGAYGRMSINNVTVTAFLQDDEVENVTSTPVTSHSSVFDNVFNYNVNYKLISGYPADGRFNSEVGVAVESWLNAACAVGNEHNQKADSLQIPAELWPFQWITTSWQCGTGEGFSFTKYAEYRDPPIRKASYVYYPLGTALGAIVGDPFNTLIKYDEPQDFLLDKPLEYNKAFVGGQMATIEYNPSKISAFLEFLPRLGDFLESIGLKTLLGNDVRSLGLQTSSGLNVSAYLERDTASGEKGVDIGMFDYSQDCDALDALVVKYNNKIIPGLEAKASSCSYPDYCFDSQGNFQSQIIACVSATSCKIDPEVQSIVDLAKGARDTVSKLASQCKGEKNDLTGLKLAGNLSLEAPFIPILAHERLQDVIITRKPVCEAPEDGLYAAKVDATITWYDQNRGGEGGANYQSCDGNLLQNGSFESEWSLPPGGSASTTKASFWNLIWKKQSSSYCDVRNDYNESNYCHAPEFNPTTNVKDQRRVLDGKLSSKWFSMFDRHDVIMYQTVNVGQNQNLDLDLYGYYQGWRMGDEVQSAGGCLQTDLGLAGDSGSQMCVYKGNFLSYLNSLNMDLSDPNYGKHPITGDPVEIPVAYYDRIISDMSSGNPNFICTSFDSKVDNEWVEHSLTRQDISGEITVLLRGKSGLPAKNTDDYWDAICLKPSGKSTVVAQQIPPTSKERTGSGGCSLYNTEQDVCEITPLTSPKKIFEETVDFYVPGLGALPFIRERISTGVGKSPDTKIKAEGLSSSVGAVSINYCEDREEEKIKEIFNISTEAEVEVYKNFSALDVYIMQNLEPRYLAIKWAKRIAPNVSQKDIEAIINKSGISGDDYDIVIPEGYDRDPIAEESQIMEGCKDAGLDKYECAYVLATARFESAMIPNRVEIGCSCPEGCTAICSKEVNGKTVYSSKYIGYCEDGYTMVNKRSYGVKNDDTEQCYYGRGYVQLTGRSNYDTMQKNAGIVDKFGKEVPYLEGLVHNADLALLPANSTKILIQYFIGRGIKRNIDDEFDYIEARGMVNGDVPTAGPKVAGIAIAYLQGGVMKDY